MDDIVRKEGKKVPVSHDTSNYYHPSGEGQNYHTFFNMDDFVCNEGSKLPASHEPSNYYHPSGLRTIPQAQVGEDCMYEGHCYYGPGSYTASGMMGSFGQLLMDANAGMLCHGNTVNLWNHSVTEGRTDDKLKCLHANTVEDICEEGDCEEGYQAGTESEVERTEMGLEVNVFLDGEGTHNANQAYSSIGDFVASFSDTITREEFMCGRGFDHDEFIRGIDDTEFDGFGVSDGENIDFQYQDDVTEESSKDGDDIGNIADIVNLEDGKIESDRQHELNKASTMERECCNDNTNPHIDHGYISPSILGDCGCAKQEIAQEISERYQAQGGVAYKKRYRAEKNIERIDCRKPRDMGAVEIAMRTASSWKTEHIFEPILGMVFDSKEEAYEFYNMYSWEYGFGIIYNKSRTTKKI